MSSNYSSQKVGILPVDHQFPHFTHRLMINLYDLLQRITLVCLIFSLPALLGAQCAANLVNNADFEGVFDGAGGEPNGYYTFSGVAAIGPSTNTPDGSAQSTEVTFNNGFGALAQSVGGLTEGVEYTFSIDVLRSPGAAGYGQITIYWRTAGGADVSIETAVNANENAAWQTISLTATAPVGMNVAAAQIAFQGDGLLLTDNWCFAQATPMEVEGCEGNLATNGTLDFNDNGWFNFSQSASVYSYTATGGVDGSGAAELSADAGQVFYGFGQQIPVTVGETYLLRAEALLTATAGYADLQLQFQDAGGTPVMGGTFQVPLDGDIFQVYEVTGTAPAGAAQAQIAIGAGNGSGVIVDNFCLLPGAFVGPAQNEPNNLVFDGGFENGTQWFDEQTEGWSCFGCGGTIRDVADPSTGTQAARITGASTDDPNVNGYNALVFEYDTPVEGAEYTASADLKRLGTTFYGQLHLYFRNAGGTDLSDEVVQADNSGVYANYTVSGIAPAGTATVILALETGNAGHLLADNVVLLEDISLPVTLSSFTGVAKNKVNAFAWTTVYEENTAMFYLERSLDGARNWSQVSTKRAAGSSQATIQYEAVDANPLSQAFYRLRSVDLDGSEQLSEIISITRQELTASAYPNPFRDNLQLITALEAPGQYRIIDALGRTLLTGALAAGDLQVNIPTATLPAGQYTLIVGEQVIRLLK